MNQFQWRKAREWADAIYAISTALFIMLPSRAGKLAGLYVRELDACIAALYIFIISLTRDAAAH